MKTTFIIAWRNCWRNALRTSIVITAIIMGIWSSVFLMGFANGFVQQRVDKMVHLEIGDLQIHSESYDTDSDIINTIKNPKETLAILDASKGVQSYAPRFKTEAFARSAHGQQGIKLLGVYPEKEHEVLELETRLQAGTFLESSLSYPILIGKKLATELHLKLNSKINISFTDANVNQISKNFKVCGIFSAGNDAFDGFTVFVPIDRIERLTGEASIHEIIVKSVDPSTIDILENDLKAKSKGNLVESWKTRYPEIAYGIEMMSNTMFILMSIIIAALLFGLVNTLVMSILERKRELGILMAVGMSRSKIRLMILFESLVYGLIGGPIGVFLGYITIQYYSYNGFDLSSFGEGMDAFGYDPIIYLSLEPKYYLIYTSYILIATFFGGLYPSRIATKLNPITAIRSI